MFHGSLLWREKSVAGKKDQTGPPLAVRSRTLGERKRSVRKFSQTRREEIDGARAFRRHSESVTRGIGGRCRGQVKHVSRKLPSPAGGHNHGDRWPLLRDKSIFHAACCVSFNRNIAQFTLRSCARVGVASQIESRQGNGSLGSPTRYF